MEQVPGGPDPRSSMEPAPQQAPAGTDPNAATPEEQAQYDQIVANAYNVIYDDKAMPAVVKMLEGDGDPVEGLARATSSVMLRVIQSGLQSNAPINGEVAFHAGTEVFEDLAELSKEAGVKDYTEDQDALEKAYFLALDYSRKALQDSGILDPEAADADLQMLQRMDSEGQLEPIMMGLAEQDAGGSQPTQRGLMPVEA